MLYKVWVGNFESCLISLPTDFPIKLVLISGVGPTTAVEISIKVAIVVASSLLIMNERR